MSPFGGVDDFQTADNIRKCELKIPSDEFSHISEDAKDFIQKLLVKNKTSRITVHEALEHAWLSNLSLEDGSQISSSKYDNINRKIKDKYSSWPAPNPSIGRLANFSSLKKHRPKEYSIYNSYFDRRDAMPRFVRKPRSQQVQEGTSAEFTCIIIAASPPVVTWYFGVTEIKQSMKYMKKYNRNSYILEIKRCGMDDKGEYIVKAVNSYGERDYNAFLNVNRKYHLKFSILF